MATESCPRSVLLIEDDRALREDIAAFLEDRGYATLPSEDVSGAIALLLQEDVPRPCRCSRDLITLVGTGLVSSTPSSPTTSSRRCRWL